MGNPNFLEQEKISTLILKFSLPAITGMLAQASYPVIARIFVGNTVGSLGISAITLAMPILMIILAFAMLVGIGSVALVSIKLGEKDLPGAERIAGNALTLSLTLSAILIAFLYFFMDPVLTLFGGSGQMLVYAKTYLHVMLWSVPFQIVAFTMNNIIRGQGNAKIAMLTMIIGAVLNILFDLLFVYILRWGMFGAGLGAVFAQFASAVWVIWYYYTGKSIIRLHFKNMALQSSIVKQIFSVGMASCIMQLMASVVLFLFNHSLMRYGGDTAIAAMGVVYSVAMMLLMPIFGLNQGVQPIIGYNYGAKRYDRVRTTLKLGMLTATAICLVGYIVVLLFPDQISRIINPKDETLIREGARALRFYLAALPLAGFQIISVAYFQAVKKPLQSLILTTTRQAAFLIPLLFILSAKFGLDGIWAATPASDTLSAILSAILITYEWKRLKAMQQERETVTFNSRIDRDNDIMTANETL